MTFDFSKWMGKYGEVAPDESIEYKDSSGTWNEETDYSLSSISSQFQQRGYIFRDELRKIGNWKAGGRIDHHLKKNSISSVERQTKLAFQAPSDEAAVEALTELTGVRVPVASTILTMADPTTFAVIDYRALRALGVVQPSLLDTQTYSDYADFMRYFREPDIEGYCFYMEIIRDIAQREGILPREVDMALWAYDKIQTS
jgi:hypothetical protein